MWYSSSGIAITEKEFWDYVGDRELVSVIKMSEVDSVKSGMTLKRIKESLGAFSPPQFFMKLESNAPIRTLLQCA